MLWAKQTSSVSHVSNLSLSHSPVDTLDLTLISNRNDDVRQFPPDPSESNDSLFKSEPETETETDSVFATLKKKKFRETYRCRYQIVRSYNQ